MNCCMLYDYFTLQARYNNYMLKSRFSPCPKPRTPTRARRNAKLSIFPPSPRTTTGANNVQRRTAPWIGRQSARPCTRRSTAFPFFLFLFLFLLLLLLLIVHDSDGAQAPQHKVPRGWDAACDPQPGGAGRQA